MPFPLTKRLTAEALGTAFLLITATGSVHMGDLLSGGDVGFALLVNAIATGAILVMILLVLVPVSGAHINPAVTLVFWLRKDITTQDALLYVPVQIAGAMAGVMLSHAMFELPLIQTATTVRMGSGQWLAEGVATFGLVATILGCLKWRPDATPFAVGLFIMSAIWFTASTCFANPALTMGRTITDTISGIQLANAPGFIAAQLIGAVLAFYCFRWLLDGPTEDAV